MPIRLHVAGLRLKAKRHRRLRLARWLTVLFGLGMLGGSLTGVFILSIVTRRAAAAGVLLGQSRARPCL